MPSLCTIPHEGLRWRWCLKKFRNDQILKMVHLSDASLTVNVAWVVEPFCPLEDQTKTHKEASAAISWTPNPELCFQSYALLCCPLSCPAFEITSNLWKRQQWFDNSSKMERFPTMQSQPRFWYVLRVCFVKTLFPALLQLPMVSSRKSNLKSTFPDLRQMRRCEMLEQRQWPKVKVVEWHIEDCKPQKGICRDAWWNCNALRVHMSLPYHFECSYGLNAVTLSRT